MASMNTLVQSSESKETVLQFYGPQFYRYMDMVGRNDFYGWSGDGPVRSLAEKMGLSRDSYVLDIGSGIGAAARYFARTYGCRVTGVDLAPANHEIAQERTKEAGLEHLASFILGDALEISYPDQSFTHVFGSDAWDYFPDKLRIYRVAHRALVPGGILAFVDAAWTTPRRFHFESAIGPVSYATTEEYASMLQAAGFGHIQHLDTTALATQAVLRAIYQHVTKREQIIDAFDERYYLGALEVWAEFLAHMSEGQLQHCGFAAAKKEVT